MVAEGDAAPVYGPGRGFSGIEPSPLQAGRPRLFPVILSAACRGGRAQRSRRRHPGSTGARQPEPREI